MNDSHLHIDPATGTEADALGTRLACPICQTKDAAEKAAAKKAAPKAE